MQKVEQIKREYSEEKMREMKNNLKGIVMKTGIYKTPGELEDKFFGEVGTSGVRRKFVLLFKILPAGRCVYKKCPPALILIS
jgi:hypothetical protein